MAPGHMNCLFGTSNIVVGRRAATYGIGWLAWTRLVAGDLAKCLRAKRRSRRHS